MLALNLGLDDSCQQTKAIKSINKSALMENNTLNIINKIVKNKPKNLRDLNALIAYAYRRDTALTTPFIEVAIGTPKTANQEVKEVEARFPLAGNSTGEILIKLSLNERTTISKKEVKNRFGASTEVTAPRPNQKFNALNYWTYQVDDVKVSFGFPYSRLDVLKVVIIKYQEAPKQD